MDRKSILTELDALFSSGRIEQVEAFLNEQINNACAMGDDDLALTLLNEQIGYYRVTTQYERALEVITKIHRQLEKMELKGSVSEGTSLLNIATVYRAMGELDEAEKCYIAAGKIYSENLDEKDYRTASLYNNLSLLYMEQGKYDLAIDNLKKSLHIILSMPGQDIKAAITYTNIGQAYCHLKKWREAGIALDTAEQLFLKADIDDEHYSGLACAQGYLQLKLGNYETAVTYYEKALLNAYKSYGITENFKNIQRDLKEAYRLSGEPEYTSMLDVCQAYYEKYGKPMIEEHFSDYRDKIAVGLCGEGSECFGLEDDISLDHDCGPGFAMWVTDEVYDEIGLKLQQAYNDLPKVFAGYIRVDTSHGRERHGVCRINEFYKRVLGEQNIPETDEDWKKIDEASLAIAVNGRIFVDKEGLFTEQREKIAEYFPRKVWLEKLGKALIYAAQTGQYNYGRAMARCDYVTADIILSEYMKSVMQVVYLLNKTYAPYYKWQRAMIRKLEILPEVGDILEALCDMPSQRHAWTDYKYDGNPNPEDMVAQTIEIVAKLIVDTLQKMNLSNNGDPYLETQGQEVLKHMNDSEFSREELIEEIVKYEWTEFDMARNEGGRAYCQNDWGTFSIMRRSQYMTWNDDMLQEYLWHIDNSLKNGRNLISEKYGRMMESTAPEKYAEIKDAFPVLSERRIQVMEAVIRIQVEWMEEFAGEFPNMAGNARSIHTSEDNADNTSYETYLRGELGTYSDELMNLYGQFVVQLSREGKNLAYMTMENTAKLYGYKDLYDAENKMCN